MHMVLPGVEEVRARFFLSVRALMREDLPTLLRPMKAYSGRPSVGHLSARDWLPMYLAEVIFIELLFLSEFGEFEPTHFLLFQFVVEEGEAFA